MISNEADTDPAQPSTPADSLWVEVSGKKAVLRSIRSRDKANKPVMAIHEPRIRLDTGSRLLVSSIHTLSPKDSGDGTILATGNVPYYFVLDEVLNGSAAGLYVRAADVRVVPLEVVEVPGTAAGDPPSEAPTDTVPTHAYEPGAGRLVEVSGEKALLHIFTTRDKAGKPIMQIREPRIRLEQGSRLSVSATRTESQKDKGEGIIHATGNIEFYYVIDQPANGEASGLYIKAADVKKV
jgi:hypothetical protein